MAFALACIVPAAAFKSALPPDARFLADPDRTPPAVGDPDTLPSATAAPTRLVATTGTGATATLTATTDTGTVATPANRTAAAPDAEAGDAGEDSVTAAPTDSGGRKFYTYISYPFLQMITLPVEVVLVPAVKLALYPTKPPLRYMLNENVIDRTIKLISFGQDDRVMLYPTMNLAPGTGSSTGLTLRDQALFGRPSERAVVQGTFFVNGDWKFRTYATAADIAGTGFNSKISLSLVHWKNNSINVPRTSDFWYFGDTSVSISGSLSHLLFEKVALRGQYVFRANQYGISPTKNQSSGGDFLRGQDSLPDERMRGLLSSWNDHIVAVGVMRDTRNNQNIVLAGSNASASYGYHLTDDHHDFQAWEGSLTNYFKLGKERYEITSEEERKAGGISMKKVMQKMELEKIRKELLNRKVLATHIYAAQSFEIPGNHMPVYGLQTLGNDTPLRGYNGSRFRDYTVLSAGAEYRFPVMRLVDGVIFNEYGVTGRSWDKIEYWSGLKNSWGFGIRVRRPDLYLFRCQLGFHGVGGLAFNLSVDEPY